MTKSAPTSNQGSPRMQHGQVKPYAIPYVDANARASEEEAPSMAGGDCSTADLFDELDAMFDFQVNFRREEEVVGREAASERPPNEEFFTLSEPTLSEPPQVVPDQPGAPDAAGADAAPRNANWNIEIEAWLADLKAKRLPSLLTALNDVRGIYTSLNHLILTHRMKELQKQNCKSPDFLAPYLEAQSGQLLDIDDHIVEEATAVAGDIWRATSFVLAAGQSDVMPVFGQVPIFVGKTSTGCDCSRSTSVGASSSIDKAGADPPPVESLHPQDPPMESSGPPAEEHQPGEEAEQHADTTPVPDTGVFPTPVDADVPMESNEPAVFERQQSLFVDAGSPSVEARTTHIDEQAAAETAYRIHRRAVGGARRTSRVPMTRSQTAQQAKRKRRMSEGGAGTAASPAAAREPKRVRRGSTPVQRPATAPAGEPAKCVDSETGAAEEAPVEVIDCDASSPSPPVEETSRIFCTHHGDVSKTENYNRGQVNRFLCSLCDEETEDLRAVARQRGWPLQELSYESSTRKWVGTFLCKHGHTFRLDHTVVRKQPWCPLCYDAKRSTTAAKNAQAAWTQAHQRILFATARENLRRTKYADDLHANPWLHPAHRLNMSPDSFKTGKATKKGLFSKAFTDSDDDGSITIERLIALGSGASPWSVLCIAPPSGGSRRRLKSKDPTYIEARARYKQWVKRVHPDKNGHRYAKEAFHILDSAWKQIEAQVVR